MYHPVDQGKKSFKTAVLEQIRDQQRELLELKKSIPELVEKGIEKSLADKYHMITTTLNEIIVQRKIFLEKGLFTMDEIKRKYEELKNARIGGQHG